MKNTTIASKRETRELMNEHEIRMHNYEMLYKNAKTTPSHYNNKNDTI